jgi:hypothetical protein
MEQITSFLSLITQGLLLIALPIVIAAAVQHFRAMTQHLRQQVGEERFNSLLSAAQTAVRAAEQAGLTQGLVGPEKRKLAIETAQSFLAARGIKVDLNQIAAVIEAEVHTQFNNPSAPVDTPQAQQALLNSAVQAAIQAAEQSGLQGLIQNVAAEKSAYAVQLALQSLNQHGLKIDPQLLTGIVSAQLSGKPTTGTLSAPAIGSTDGPAG